VPHDDIGSGGRFTTGGAEVAGNMLFRDAVTVAPRFSRSVNLERDMSNPDALHGYTVTSAAFGALHRIVASIHRPGHHAWTLTGPYGSGKSAFALYLAHLLSTTSSQRKTAAALLQGPDMDRLTSATHDSRRRPAYWPVLVSGSRRSLAAAMLSGCLQSLPEGRPLKLKRRLQELLAVSDTVPIPGAEVVRALRDLTLWVRDGQKADGVLLVVDELGKLLEHATRRPDLSDVHILQELAEATAEHCPAQLLVVTILHQAFESYVGDVRPEAREEWAKIQGRFEDIAFLDPPEELLRLLGQAIVRSRKPVLASTRTAAHELSQRAARLGLIPAGTNRQATIDVLVRCAPIHPVAALTLVRLCRKFGQNHRSLFSFLTSNEPHGFQDYLERTEIGPNTPLFGLPQLYDYVSGALGNGLLAGEASSRWAEVQSALERSAAYPPDQIAVLKAVGLLAAIGAHGELKTSPSVVQFGAQLSGKSAAKALETLSKRGTLVFRNYTNTYGLWQGNDVDLAERRVEAKRRAVSQARLVERANVLAQARPIVAKRHSYEHGTLRYFRVRYADELSLQLLLSESLEDEDGLLILALPATAGERDRLLAVARSPLVASRSEVVVGVAADTRSLDELVAELERWVWISSNTPELAGDAAARREVISQISHLGEFLSRELAALFEPGTGRAGETKWFHRGVEAAFPDSRSMAQFLSSVCDEVFHASPKLHNELVNRRTLSSSAAAARRNLIQALLVNSDREDLGLQGFGPETSIYASVFKKTGIHRLEADGTWGVGRPNLESLRPAWDAIESFLDSSDAESRPLSELFGLLRRPPFGMTQGLMPLLLVAVILARESEVALYEEGTFLPEMTIDCVERLLRQPDKFDVRSYPTGGVRKSVYRSVSKLLSAESAREPQTIVDVVRPLYAFFNALAPYSRNTKDLSVHAVAVRQALSDAKDPDRLVFDELPRACGIAGRIAVDDRDDGLAVLYVDRLRLVIDELRRSYDVLLAGIESSLFMAFNAPSERGRDWVCERASRVASIAMEPRLRGIVSLLMGRETADRWRWIEALATMVSGKPPRSWYDIDRERFEIGLTEIARAFRHAEVLADADVLGGGNGSTAAIMRIGVTTRGARDLEAVVTVPDSHQDQVSRVAAAVRAEIVRLGLVDYPELALAAISIVAQPLLSKLVESPTDVRAKGGLGG
jgi:hypothetical protein